MISAATTVSPTFYMYGEVALLPAFASFACSGPLKPMLEESLHVAFGAAAPPSPRR